MTELGEEIVFPGAISVVAYSSRSVRRPPPPKPSLFDWIIPTAAVAFGSLDGYLPLPPVGWVWRQDGYAPPRLVTGTFTPAILTLDSIVYQFGAAHPPSA